ncbi:MAG: hypothetical protein NC823_02640 [Candidatus Omnitrophica bacterium]|nr:hypothetical protein [Candidatus Omnitrophota bacterium]
MALVRNARAEVWPQASWKDVSISFQFKLSAMPERKMPIFAFVCRGKNPDWSEKGVSQTFLAEGQWLEFFVIPEKSTLGVNRWVQSGKEKFHL